MTYRPHRSHVQYAPVVASMNPKRRRPQRLPLATMPVPVGPETPAIIYGLVYGVPFSLLLWAAIVVTAWAAL